VQVVHDAGVENATYNGITKSYPVNAFCNQQHELIVTMVTVLLAFLWDAIPELGTELD
jgi:hypothetical protein